MISSILGGFARRVKGVFREDTKGLRPRTILWMLPALLLLLAADDEALRILEARCLECHHAAKTKGGLDLTSRESLLKGGETGPALALGQPDKSRLWRVTARLDEPFMPHKRDPLPDAELRAIADWIRAGASYARPLKPPGPAGKKEFAITADDRKHWAFLPVRRPPPPDVRDTAWVRTPVDRFLLARLEAAGLTPAPTASRETLLRRATFDLTGLPPTPEEIEAFLREGDWGKVVDRLLASPRYGERWGRHWLDLARYAETDGFEHDAVRPHAWRYRDYVIRAFNADKPFDRFAKEQLAGDELWPEDPDAQIATGFGLLGPDMVDSSDQVQRRLNTLSDMTDVTSSVFLGLTLGCARCHDHKFEPLAQRDYYRLMAFFSSASFKTDRPVPTAEQRAAYARDLEAWRALPQLRELAELETPVREKLRAKKLAKVNDEMRAAVGTPPEQRTVEQANLALETEPLLEVSDKEIAEALPPAERARRKTLLEEAKKLPQPPQLPKAACLAAGKPVKTFLLYRGEHSMPREEVDAGFPEVLGGAAGPGGRAALAAWITGRDNPLTARVIVNRVWQHHFGRGIVPSPSEFGPRGRPPSHPELLDWLAAEFVEGGWSLKTLHRLLLTSSAYLVSTSSKGDPENLLFGRRIRMRLEGEAIRDSLLFLSGRLVEKQGGPGVFPPVPSDVLKGSRGWTVSADLAEQRRRSVYIFARRNLRFPFLEVFDAPDSNLSTAERGRSTTAPQSLTLLNAPEVVEAAAALAALVEREAEGVDARVTRLYLRVLGRRPGERELEAGRAFLAASPLREYCRALFNLNAFVYVE